MPNTLNTSPETEKEWEELLSQLPDILDEDYSTQTVITGLRMAGWDGKENMRTAGQLALLLHESHDSKTLALLSSEDQKDKKQVVESIISNLEDLDMDEFIRFRPEAMAYVFNAWNETHPDEPQKTFPAMKDQLTRGLREEFASNLPENDDKIDTNEFAAGMIAAGFDSPEDAALVTAIYKLGVEAGDVDILYDISNKKYTSRGELLKDLRQDITDYRVKEDIEKALPGELAMVEEAWTQAYGLNTLDKDTFLSNAQSNGWYSNRDRQFLSQLYDEARANENPTLAGRVLEINSKDLWGAFNRNEYMTSLKEEIASAEGLSRNLKSAAEGLRVNINQERLDSERRDQEEKKVAESFVERAVEMGWKAEDVQLLRAINTRIEDERHISTNATAMIEFRRRIMETPLDQEHYYTSRNNLLREAEKIDKLWSSFKTSIWSESISLQRVVRKSLGFELGETHEERKSLWLKKMADVGWTAPGDAEFLSMAFDAGLNADKSVDLEYDRVLDRLADPKEKLSREDSCQKLVACIIKMDASSPEQDRICDRISEERRLWQRLSPSRFALPKVDKNDLVHNRIKDPHLAETVVLANAAGNVLKDKKEFIKFLTDSNLSAGIFYETLRSRINDAAEKAIHSHSDLKTDVNFAEKMLENTRDRYNITEFYASPEETQAQRERANAIIDGWVRDGMIFCTSVNVQARIDYENEKKAFVSQAEQAGWNEAYAHDREKMEDLFDARYDMNGNVIPAVDEAIRNFALGDGDKIAQRRQYLNNVKQAITAIPQNERSAGAVRALKTLNNSASHWESNLRDREEFVQKAENCGFGLTKDELRSVFASFRYTDGGYSFIYSELVKGESKTYPQLPYSKDSKIAALQQNDLFVRMHDLLKNDKEKYQVIFDKEKTLDILEKKIAETAEEAKREREQELPRVIEEKRAAFEAKAEQFKEQGLKLTEADLKAFEKLDPSFYRSTPESRALRALLRNSSELGESMKAAAKDWNSEEARPFKEGLINLDKAVGEWLNTVNDKKHVKPAMFDMITKINPVRADEWRVKMAQKEMVNAAELMAREDQRAQQERQNAQALAVRQQQKESLMTILRNIERTGNSYAGHTNTDAYNNMVNALKTLREHGRPEEGEQYDNLVQNVKEHMKNYLDKKDGLESSWHKNGNVRRECAFLGLSIIDPPLGAEYIGRANEIRWRRNHISLETLKNKRGVGLLARSLQQADAAQAQAANAHGQVNNIGFENLAAQAGAHEAHHNDNRQNSAQREQIRAGAAERRSDASKAKNGAEKKVPQRDAMKKN